MLLCFADNLFEDLAELNACEIHFCRCVGAQRPLCFGHFAIDGHQANHFFEHAYALSMLFGDRDFDLTGADSCQSRFEFVAGNVPSFGAIDQESDFFLSKFVVNRGKVHQVVEERQALFVHRFFFRVALEVGFANLV